MPTTYTPNAGNNPASYSLPSDLDPNTAESVNAALRAIGDKAAYAIATRAALAALNTFTRGQEIEPTDEGEALLTSRRYPSDITTDNRWALAFRFKTENDRWLRMYIGGLQGVGRMAWTHNAEWSVASQEWSLDDSGAEASAIIWMDDHFTVHHVASGTSPFMSWPSTGGSSNEGSLRCVGEFRYVSTKTRLRSIPTSSACGPTLVSGADGSIGAAVIGDHSYIRWPLRLPPGAQLQYVRVLHNVAGGASEVFRVTRRRTVWDPGDPQTPSEDVLVEVTSSSSNGARITTLTTSTVVNREDELCLLWEPAAVLLGNVHAIQVEWLDQGPTPV